MALIWSRLSGSSSVRTKWDHRQTSSKGMRPKDTVVKSIWSRGKSWSKGADAAAASEFEAWKGGQRHKQEKAVGDEMRNIEREAWVRPFRHCKHLKWEISVKADSWQQIADTIWTSLLRICLGSRVQDRLGWAEQGWKQQSRDDSRAGDTRQQDRLWAMGGAETLKGGGRSGGFILDVCSLRHLVHIHMEKSKRQWEVRILSSRKWFEPEIHMGFLTPVKITKEKVEKRTEPEPRYFNTN